MSAVSAASDNGLEGVNEGENGALRIGTGGELLEEACDLGRVASQLGLDDGQADAAINIVVLSTVAPVGEVAGDGFALRLCGVFIVASFRLNVG